MTVADTGHSVTCVSNSHSIADTTFSVHIFAKSGMIIHQINYDPFEYLYHCEEYYGAVLVILNMYYLALSKQCKDCLCDDSLQFRIISGNGANLGTAISPYYVVV